MTYRNSFITGMAVDRENVAELAACGWARWKIENEVSTPEDQGSSPGAQFGHGQQNLSAVLATPNLLASPAIRCDLGGRAWKSGRRELVTRPRVVDRTRALTSTWCSRPGTICLRRWPSCDRHCSGHKPPVQTNAP